MSGATTTERPVAGTATGPTLRSSVQASRGPVLVVLALVVAAVVVGLLSVRPSGSLDPDAYDPAGSRALAELLRDRGTEVVRVGTVEQARELAREGSVTLLPAPQGLAVAELEALAGLPGGLVVVAPDDEDLGALGLPVVVAGSADVEARRPACDLTPATRAGDADLGGTTYTAVGGVEAIGCYGAGGSASLVVLPELPAIVLGTGTPLTNERLDDRGNAALVLGLLSEAEQVVWLVPAPGREVPDGEQRSLTSLLPDALRLGLVQLAVAVVLLALWRARRLGRVVEEPLPVVVRAAEAVEGRGRLYRAAGARGPAAQALRAGVRERSAARLGLSATDRPGLVARVAARTGREPGGVDALLYGAPPADDAALVRLADALRALEQELAGSGLPPGGEHRPPDPQRGADRP